MIGGLTGRPVANSTGPGTPTPTPRTSPRPRPASASSRRSARAASAAPASGPTSIARSSACSASTSPPRSVTARRECVAPRSAARTTPASRLNTKVRGGRPPVDWPSSASNTSRSAISASTRWATVERAIPVSSTSSARVLARPWRIRLSMAPAPAELAEARAFTLSVKQSELLPVNCRYFCLRTCKSHCRLLGDAGGSTARKPTAALGRRCQDGALGQPRWRKRAGVARPDRRRRAGRPHPRRGGTWLRRARASARATRSLGSAPGGRAAGRARPARHGLRADVTGPRHRLVRPGRRPRGRGLPARLHRRRGHARRIGVWPAARPRAATPPGLATPSASGC